MSACWVFEVFSSLFPVEGFDELVLWAFAVLVVACVAAFLEDCAGGACEDVYFCVLLGEVSESAVCSAEGGGCFCPCPDF